MQNKYVSVYLWIIGFCVLCTCLHKRVQAHATPTQADVGELPALNSAISPGHLVPSLGEVLGDGSVGFLGRVRLPKQAHKPFDIQDFGARQARDYFLTQCQNGPGCPDAPEATSAPMQLLLQATQGLDHAETAAYFVQAWRGIPIETTFALAVMGPDNLRYARHFFVVNPNIDVQPTVTSNAAQASALSYMRPRAAQANLTADPAGLTGRRAAAHPSQTLPPLEPELVIIYGHETPHTTEAASGDAMPKLAWRIDVDTQRPWEKRTVYIDAHTGVPLATRKRSHDAARGRVSFAVEPQCDGDAPLSLPMPYVRLNGVAATDARGDFALSEPVTQVQISLDNPYVHLINHNGKLAGPWTYALAAHGHNDITIADSALDQIDPLFHIQQARAWVRTHVPQSNLQTQWTDERLDVHVNMDDTCNAYYDGTLHFFAAGDGCLNTARVANLVYHEYAHGIHGHSTPTAARITPDAQISEGTADYIAATLTGNPNMRGIYGCLDNFRSCVNNLSYCEGGQCDFSASSEPHTAGQVLCGAWWKLRRRLIGRYGNVRGVALCDRLHLKFLTLVGNMHSAYQATIAADDDDDLDPSNGTRHSCDINAAFLDAPPTGGSPHFPDQPGRVACVPSPQIRP